MKTLRTLTLVLAALGCSSSALGAQGIIILAQRQFQRLHRVRAAMDAGRPAEDAFRQSMLMSQGSLSIFVSNPLVATITTDGSTVTVTQESSTGLFMDGDRVRVLNGGGQARALFAQLPVAQAQRRLGARAVRDVRDQHEDAVDIAPHFFYYYCAYTNGKAFGVDVQDRSARVAFVRARPVQTFVLESRIRQTGATGPHRAHLVPHRFRRIEVEPA